MCRELDRNVLGELAGSKGNKRRESDSFTEVSRRGYPGRLHGAIL
jgi:hypothetical protein